VNRYLLDTHILIWWLYDLPQLQPHHRTFIEDTQNAIYVSTASLWEIEIKRGIGKLVIDDRYQEAIESGGFEMLAIEAAHTLGLRSLPSIHNDPFDRMLIAQAKCEKMALLTVDEKVKQYPVSCL
jgi:PIN domain nuclease of toxin-antitoxin system